MSEPFKSDKNLILMGRIGAAHGVKGSLRVKSFCANMLDLGKYGALQDNKGNHYSVKNIRPQKTMTIVRFNEVTSREQAQTLNGVELFIKRDKLPSDLAKEEFYIADIIGMDVLNLDKKLIGTIIDVPNFGAGDMIEISPLTDNGKFSDNTYYIEFTKNNVPKIDFEKNLLIINPPVEINERDIKVEDNEVKNEQIEK